MMRTEEIRQFTGGSRPIGEASRSAGGARLAQPVRHAGGRRFESRRSRHAKCLQISVLCCLHRRESPVLWPDRTEEGWASSSIGSPSAWPTPDKRGERPTLGG